MDNPLLKTRFLIPDPCSGAIQRQRLIEQLNTVAQRRLTLVCAPAGFGKTTLVSQWLESGIRQGNIAWFSLAEELNETHQFTSYLLSALQCIDPLIVQTAQIAWDNTHQLSVLAVITAIINDLAVYGEPIVLVMDDYHVVSNQVIHDAVDHILANAPANLHLILISRADPPLSLPRYRARGQVAEIRAADLRFTYAETAQLLNETRHLQLTTEALQALLERTEGWATGLQLAAISLNEIPAENRAEAVSAFAGNNRYILDYLMDEVFVLQPSHIQAFLLNTAILSTLNPALCDAVSGQTGSQGVLRQLDETNIFVQPLDTNHTTFRYHHLFADLLRYRLRETAPQLEKELHRRASAWYFQHDMEAEAIHHALAADDFELAIEQTQFLNPAMVFGEPELCTVQLWLRNLPQEFLLEHPQLWTYHVWALLWAGDLPHVEIHLEALQIISSDAAEMLWPGHVEAMQALIAYYRGNFGLAAQVAQSALEALLPQDKRTRFICQIILGASFTAEGDLQAATHLYSQVGWTGQQEESNDAVLFSLAHLAWLALLAGNSSHAHRILMLAEESIEASTRQELQGLVALVRGMLLYEQNQINRAHELLVTGIKQCEGWPLLTAIVTDASVTYARLLAYGLHQATKAQAILEHTARQIRRQGVTNWNLGKLAVFQQRLNSDQVASASAITPPEAALGFLSEYEYLAHARSLIAQHRHAEAGQLLADIREIADREGRLFSVLQCLILEALNWQAGQELEKALVVLDQALTLAEKMGFIRIFVDEGPALTRLLLRFGQQRLISSEAFYERVIAAFPGDEVQALRRSMAPDTLDELLTERETEVLELLAEGLSATEIADQLMVSLNTSKTHIKRIYSKLHVHSRYEAIEQARHRQLIDDWQTPMPPP